MATRIVKLKSTKLFRNKRNGQHTIIIPSKKVKSIKSTLKFDEELFVRLEFLKKKKRKVR